MKLLREVDGMKDPRWNEAFCLDDGAALVEVTALEAAKNMTDDELAEFLDLLLHTHNKILAQYR